jgi:hypothetical protein
MKTLHEEQDITEEDMSLSVCWYKLIKDYYIIQNGINGDFQK